MSLGRQCPLPDSSVQRIYQPVILVILPSERHSTFVQTSVSGRRRRRSPQRTSKSSLMECRSSRSIVSPWKQIYPIIESVSRNHDSKKG